MMNVLMLNYEFPPIGGGGGQAHWSLLQQYAGRKDLRIDVLTSAAKPDFITEEFADNVTIFRVGIHKKNLHFWRRTEILEWLFKAKPCYRRLLKAEKYDLVHAFFGFPSGWLCYRTAKRLPYIVSLRGSDVPGQNARLQWEYKIMGPLVFKPIWKKAAALVACSEGLQARALKFMPEAGIDVIPNGVDLERFHPAASGPGDGSAPLRLITVGRLSSTKRLPMLIDMVQWLGNAGCPVQLTIVGGGSGEADLRRAREEANLRDAVTIRGRCEADAMPDLYRAHDVYVSASAQEGMSNAMLEAMASGLPIVTTPCEGVDELIADNGIVVEDAQAPALAQAVEGLARDRARCAALAAAARSRAEKFTWASAADRYIHLYENVSGTG